MPSNFVFNNNFGRVGNSITQAANITIDGNRVRTQGGTTTKSRKIEYNFKLANQPYSLTVPITEDNLVDGRVTVSADDQQVGWLDFDQSRLIAGQIVEDGVTETYQTGLYQLVDRNNPSKLTRAKSGSYSIKADDYGRPEGLFEGRDYALGGGYRIYSFYRGVVSSLVKSEDNYLATEKHDWGVLAINLDDLTHSGYVAHYPFGLFEILYQLTDDGKIEIVVSAEAQPSRPFSSPLRDRQNNRLVEILQTDNGPVILAASTDFLEAYGSSVSHQQALQNWIGQYGSDYQPLTIVYDGRIIGQLDPDHCSLHLKHNPDLRTEPVAYPMIDLAIPYLINLLARLTSPTTQAEEDLTDVSAITTETSKTVTSWSTFNNVSQSTSYGSAIPALRLIAYLYPWDS